MVRALTASGAFQVRALTRNPDEHRQLAEEVVEADLGNVVAGAVAHPGAAGNGEYLPLVGDFLSFTEILETLARQGHKLSYRQMPKEQFAGAFPGAAEIAEMFGYWEAHTYLGSAMSDEIALANKIAGRRPTNFADWARANFPAKAT